MKAVYFLFFLVLSGCYTPHKSSDYIKTLPEQFIAVLGIAQDAGYPQPYCAKNCCEAVEKGTEKRQNVTCLGIVDKETQQAFMIEATPDFTQQEKILRGYLSDKSKPINGIFLTHAHMGHYTGLMYLGREAIGAKEMPIYVMPKMKTFLEKNGPWSQLIDLKNIKLISLEADKEVFITKNIFIKPLIVPHRDEFSETVGYIISGKSQKILFIPDIDKWSKWQMDIQKVVQNVDFALLDGTFYENGELPNRDMSEVPHPFIEETIKIFQNSIELSKIKFIHFNHTNPVMRQTPERKAVLEQGFGICKEGDIIDL